MLDSINEALAKDAATRGSAGAQAKVGAALAALTDREREVLHLVVKGLSNKLIAKELNISHRTVEQHRSRIFDKLGVASTAELIHALPEQRG